MTKILLRVFITAAVLVLAASFPTYNECDASSRVCEFWLEVAEDLTMIMNESLVYAYKSKLYKYGDKAAKVSYDIPIDKVITVDGVNRMVLAVNRTIPGPPIIVYEYQTVIVHVKNKMLSESLTIHWHGLLQRGTPYMDGVEYITQCPIGPGQSFRYEFKADLKGTYWYHSHSGAQRTSGVFGAFIVKERPKGNESFPTEFIMTVTDWQHESSAAVYKKSIYSIFEKADKYLTTKAVDGGLFPDIPWVSGLIEGKGRYKDPKNGYTIEAPLMKYEVQYGSEYRFRVIHTGQIYPFRISVDGHELEVIACDGNDIKPLIVESIIIQPGERYDFLLKADRPAKNYWIRASTLEIDTNHGVKAILHYVESESDKEPSTARKNCTETSPCRILNCPFLQFSKLCTECIPVHALRSLNDQHIPELTATKNEHFLNFAFPGSMISPGGINGRTFQYPEVNALTQRDEIGKDRCIYHNCGNNNICQCYNELNLPYNETIQLVLFNIGKGAGMNHPIHMHGHSFYVLKIVFGEQDKTTGELKSLFSSKDINCADNEGFCNQAYWRNESWYNGNIPGLNLKDPPRKDTIVIPTGGYAVIRIRTDNPGLWFMHCHLNVHALRGMAIVLAEAVNHLPQKPLSFPRCSSFPPNELKSMKVSSIYDENAKVGPTECNIWYWRTTVLEVIAILQTIFLAFFCCKNFDLHTYLYPCRHKYTRI